MYASALVRTSDLFCVCVPSLRLVLIPLLFMELLDLLARRLGMALPRAMNLAFMLVRYRFSTALWAALRLLATVSLVSSAEWEAREERCDDFDDEEDLADCV